MSKTIRPTYPVEFSAGVLLLVFVISCFLSLQIFDTRLHDLHQNESVYFGMFLASAAVIIMILIIWEEILFPIKIKPVAGGIEFRNHRTKLRAQALIYCSIPAIFIFIYFEYEVNLVRFIIWAAVCTIAPVVEKIFSGLNNYNDFLRLTDTEIEYKNNEKEGRYKINEINSISIVRDERNIIKNLQLGFSNNSSVIIDLDEMELDAFYDSIYSFITTHYQTLVK